MRKSVFLISAVATLFYTGYVFSGGVPAAEPEPEGSSQTFPIDLDDPDAIEAGKSIFHSTCADYCHGHEPVLFIGRGDELEPEYVYKTIYEGGKGATPMPPWGEVFSEEEIWELVSYIKYLGTQ